MAASFAVLDRSPDPVRLAEAAAKSIREHPLAESAIQRQIAEDERVRRLVACGKIEAARQAIATDHYLSDVIVRCHAPRQRGQGRPS
jgi:hypothetical protein